MEDVADRARAVVALRLEASVAAAPDVGLLVDPVGGPDCAPHLVRRARGHARGSVGKDRGLIGWRAALGSPWDLGGRCRRRARLARGGGRCHENAGEQKSCQSKPAPSATRARQQTIPPPVPSHWVGTRLLLRGTVANVDTYMSERSQIAGASTR